MQTVDILDATTELSRLVDRAAAGEPFVIARAGQPLVKVVPLEPADRPAPRRRGFLAGQVSVPADFDTMGQAEIEEMFGLND